MLPVSASSLNSGIRIRSVAYGRVSIPNLLSTVTTFIFINIHASRCSESVGIKYTQTPSHSRTEQVTDLHWISMV
jgi:hypothetical protein